VVPGQLEARLQQWLRQLEGCRGRAPLPDLGRATLLLLDLQRLFVDPRSPAFLPAWPAVARPCAALLAAFRKAGLPVLWTQHLNAGQDDEGGTIAHFGGRPLRPSDPLSQLAAPWQPLPGEALLRKPRYSPWLHTDLEERVPAGASLVIAGVTTHRCLLAAAVEGASRDRLPVVVADASATSSERLHLAALQALANGFAYVASAAEVMRGLLPA